MAAATPNPKCFGKWGQTPIRISELGSDPIYHFVPAGWGVGPLPVRLTPAQNTRTSPRRRL